MKHITADVITSEEHDVTSWVALWWRDFVVDVPEDGFSDLIQCFGAILRQTKDMSSIKSFIK